MPAIIVEPIVSYAPLYKDDDAYKEEIRREKKVRGCTEGVEQLYSSYLYCRTHVHHRSLLLHTIGLS